MRHVAPRPSVTRVSIVKIVNSIQPYISFADKSADPDKFNFNIFAEDVAADEIHAEHERYRFLKLQINEVGEDFPDENRYSLSDEGFTSINGLEDHFFDVIPDSATADVSEVNINAEITGDREDSEIFIQQKTFEVKLLAMIKLAIEMAAEHRNFKSNNELVYFLQGCLSEYFGVLTETSTNDRPETYLTQGHIRKTRIVVEPTVDLEPGSPDISNAMKSDDYSIICKRNNDGTFTITMCR